MSGFLKQISKNNLIFNEQQTRDILVLFAPSFAKEIKNMPIDDNQRAFAQAILIEAADASKKVSLVLDFAEFALTHNPKKIANLLKSITNASQIIYDYQKDTKVSIDLINNSELSQDAINVLRRNFKTDISAIVNGEGKVYLKSETKDTPTLSENASQQEKFDHALELVKANQIQPKSINQVKSV